MELEPAAIFDSGHIAVYRANPGIGPNIRYRARNYCLPRKCKCSRRFTRARRAPRRARTWLHGAGYIRMWEWIRWTRRILLNHQCDNSMTLPEALVLCTLIKV